MKSDLTNAELCEKYDITPLTLNRIKFCKGTYNFLKDEMGLEVPEKKDMENKVEKMFKNNYTVDEIANVTGLCTTTIYNIKKRLRDQNRI